jgi:hypothetical protein
MNDISYNKMTCIRCGVLCEVNYCFTCKEVISNGLTYKYVKRFKFTTSNTTRFSSFIY